MCKMKIMTLNRWRRTEITKNMTTGLRWTYFQELATNEGLYHYDGPGPYLMNFGQQLIQ